MSAKSRADISASNHDANSPEPKGMGFLEHLEDLRKRLWIALIIIFIGMAASLFFADVFISFLTKHFNPRAGDNLALLYPTEGFVVRMKVAFVMGILITTPFWFTQFWGFVSPGLYKKEKKIIVPVIIISSLMFLIGASFGWHILPFAVNYFQSLTVSDVAVTWALDKYIDFTLRLLIAFGVIFELPLIIFIIARLGIVSTMTLRKYRRHAIVGLLVLSAIITPPDVITQILLTLPLVLLYEIGIWTAYFAEKKGKSA